jgi:hypothetical protein
MPEDVIKVREDKGFTSDEEILEAADSGIGTDSRGRTAPKCLGFTGSY